MTKGDASGVGTGTRGSLTPKSTLFFPAILLAGLWGEEVEASDVI